MLACLHRQFSSVQFSSVQFNGVPRRPDHLRRKRSGRHGAAQLAWLDERCWHGLVIPSAARRARARGPPLTSFGVMAFWPDKGRQGGDGGWRSGGKGGRGRLLSARHTLPARTISRMRVRATHRRLQHAMGAAAEVLAQDAEREQQREAGRRRRGQQQQRGRTSARRTTSSDRWRSKVHGAGPRGTRVRHCPPGSVSQVLNCARAC